MKLPNTSKQTSGFSMIELLIVISIIAVLSVIGAVIFSGVQKGSRDSRRVADINAIAAAMEAKYGSGANAGQYVPLAGIFFSNGQIPTDPTNGSASCGSGGNVTCAYCVRYQGAAAAAAGNIGACAATDTVVGAGQPTGGGTNRNWVVCANLEGAASGTTGAGARYYHCRQNQQ